LHEHERAGRLCDFFLGYGLLLPVPFCTFSTSKKILGGAIMKRDYPVVFLDGKELDIDFPKDKTTYSTITMMSLMDSAQLKIVHDYVTSIYLSGDVKPGRSLADGTWQGGKGGSN
jgi:hypothetical protein